jgi:hypothetical protein
MATRLAASHKKATKRVRRNHRSAFKAKVALADLAKHFDVHAKIGELTLENDILEDALGRGNQPSARR